MRDAMDSKIKERRKKRVFMPLFYGIAEVVLVWLLLSVFHVDFNLFHWDIWSKIILGMSTFYSIAKTLHVYNRQKSYSDS